VQPREPEDTPRPESEYPAAAANRQEAQTRLVIDELADLAEPGPVNWQQEGIAYFVRKDFLLVDDERNDMIRATLRTGGRLPESPEEEEREGQPRDNASVYGLRWVRLRTGIGAMDTLRFLTEQFGEEIQEHVGPEFLVHIAPSTGSCCPADEPEPAAPGTPPDPPMTGDRGDGTGVKVVVVDTGFDPDAAALPWMRGVTGDPEPGVTPGQPLPKYAGHGTFIAGIVRAMAPQAEVLVRAAFHTLGKQVEQLGLVFEKELVTALLTVMRDDHPDVINLSAGTFSDRVQGPMLLNRFQDRVLRRHKGVVVVAAAGNDNTRRTFWPACATWTVGVGALAGDWRTRAPFSNFGRNADVYAPGQHLINAFRSGPYTYQEPPKAGQLATFHGMASWSGTSFAAPVVAGLIAARMSNTGENGQEAAAALLAEARTVARPGVGAVILPG
jgi:hypothetical protein